MIWNIELLAIAGRKAGVSRVETEVEAEVLHTLQLPSQLPLSPVRSIG